MDLKLNASTKSFKPRTLTKEDLSRDLKELLNLKDRSGTNRRTSKAYKIVGTVLNVIKSALLRGESVEIPGFGIFKIRTRPPTRHGCVFHYHMNRRGSTLIRSFPPKKYVHFQPSKPLKRLLNA